MSVRDHGLEVLKKSAVEITPGDPSEYRLRVEGTFSSEPPVGGATEAKQDVGNASLASIDSKLASPMPVSDNGGSLTVDGPLTDTQLRATAVPVSETYGVLSTANSTTATLGSNATFTGTSEDTTNYVAAAIALGVDRNGTLNVDFSPDGTNWDQVQTYPITVASPGSVSGFYFQFMCEARYFRLRYVNGATAQGAFRLQTIFKIIPGTAEVHAVNTAILANTDALTTKGVIYGLSSGGGGTYVAVKVSPSGSLQTALGDISGVVGQNTMVNSLPVAIASNQSAIPVTNTEVAMATGTQTSVAGSASSVTLLAANASRLNASIYNDSTAILYIRCQATASTSNFTVKLFPEGYWEVPKRYTGIIDGIWASATGNARVTEYT